MILTVHTPVRNALPEVMGAMVITTRAGKITWRGCGCELTVHE